jgi:hypothetical protein
VFKSALGHFSEGKKVRSRGVVHSISFTLVGGFNPSEEYQSVGTIIPNIWENKKSSKPPTRLHYINGR